MLPFTVVHLVFIAALLILAPGIFKGYDDNTYRDVVYGMRTAEILKEVEQYDDYILATDSYSESSLLSYHSRRHIMVFGESSYHGREDDKITDFRKLDGKNILVVSYYPKQEYRKYFDKSEMKKLSIEQTHFNLFLGKGFRYQVYRDEMLHRIVQRYYRIPPWLPVGSCYMYERYGFDQPES